LMICQRTGLALARGALGSNIPTYYIGDNYLWVGLPWKISGANQSWRCRRTCGNDWSLQLLRLNTASQRKCDSHWSKHFPPNALIGRRKSSCLQFSTWRTLPVPKPGMVGTWSQTPRESFRHAVNALLDRLRPTGPVIFGGILGSCSSPMSQPPLVSSHNPGTIGVALEAMASIRGRSDLRCARARRQLRSCDPCHRLAEKRLGENVIRKRSHGDGGIDQGGADPWRVRYRIGGRRFTQIVHGTSVRPQLGAEGRASP
jgi:hypothetical protein